MICLLQAFFIEIFADNILSIVYLSYSSKFKLYFLFQNKCFCYRYFANGKVATIFALNLSQKQRFFSHNMLSIHFTMFN